MNFETIPRVSLASTPTPLEFLPRLTENLGGPRIFIKRDDLTGPAGGGNKVRKLEYLVADAVAQGANVLVTVGGLQSNHARQTAGVAAKLGLDCEVVLEDCVDGTERAYQYSGNVLLDDLFGARIHRVTTTTASPLPWSGKGASEGFVFRGALEDAVKAVLAQIRERGDTPYYIPVGGSTPIGALGYVRAVREIADQLDALSIANPIFLVPTGSAGTQAGIVAGLAVLGRSDIVIGIAVSGNREDKEASVARLVQETLGLLRHPLDGIIERIRVEDGYVGAGYGRPTKGMLEAVRWLARWEGVLLDPVYTGKAMAGLFDLIRKGDLTADHTVIFWHTGGSAALFAYPSLFSRAAMATQGEA